MKLWRLDAMHESDDVEGAFCLYFRDEMDARIREQTLVAVGWMTDVYEEDLGHLSREEIGLVVEVPWPLAPNGLVREHLRKVEQMNLDEAHL